MHWSSYYTTDKMADRFSSNLLSIRQSKPDVFKVTSGSDLLFGLAEDRHSILLRMILYRVRHIPRSLKHPNCRLGHK